MENYYLKAYGSLENAIKALRRDSSLTDSKSEKRQNAKRIQQLRAAIRLNKEMVKNVQNARKLYFLK